MPDQHQTPESPAIAPPAPDEFQKYKDFFDVVSPQLAKLNELVANGWLPAGSSPFLIDAALQEITLLRAERIPPPMNHSLLETCQAAFAVMSAKVREGLHRTEKTVQQTRFDAFAAGVEVMLPSHASHVRLEVYHLFSTILAGDIAHFERVLRLLDDSTSPHFEARKTNSAETRGRLWALKRFYDLIVALKAGSTTPQQALDQAERVRAEGGAPPGATIQ